MQTNKINRFLATFNLFLIFIGYQLVTTLFLPNFASYDGTQDGTLVSRAITVPYRAFALGISLIVLLLNWRKPTKTGVPLKLYFFFWLMLILRIFYDLFIRTDVHVNSSNARELIIYVFCVCLIPSLSAYKSLSSISLEKAFKFILWGYAILIPLFYYNNPLLFSIGSTDYRLSGNIAMNTIAFGHYGVTLTLLSFFWGKNTNINWEVYLSYFFMLIGVFVMLRAGSRGPLVALFTCFIFYYISRQKTSNSAVIIFLSIVAFIYAISDLIFDAIRAISPILAERLTLSGRYTELEEFSNGRSSLYDQAIEKFYDSPIFGESFAIINSDGSFIYSHNMVLDAFMALGLLGGIMFIIILLYAFIKSRFLIMSNFKHWWIALLCIQYIIYNLMSGAFYQSATLNVLLIMALYYSQRESSLNKIIYEENNARFRNPTGGH